MSVSNWGLAVFLVSHAGAAVALLADAAFSARGVPTISQQVWVNPWLGAPFLLWLLAGAAGLTAHFYGAR